MNMKMNKISPIVLFTVTLCSYLVTIIVRPVWSDIRVFLGLASFPFMETVTLLILASCAWAVSMMIFENKKNRIVMPLVLAFIWFVLVGYLIKELGHDMPMMTNIPLDTLPLIFSFAGGALIVLSILLLLRKEVYSLIGGGLLVLVAAGIMISPYQPGAMKMLSEPRVFLGDNGSLSVLWATSKPGSSYLEYGRDENLGNTIRPEKHGLLNWSPRNHRISLSAAEAENFVYFRVVTRAVTRVYPTSVVSGASVSSPVIKYSPLPASGDTSFIVLTDYHNRTRVRDALINVASEGWEYQMIALTGDMVESFFSDRLLAVDVLDAGTADISVPVAYARGNHDTRGAYARDFASWILPDEGQFYYSFTIGDVAIVVLDTGEDKLDDDSEYSGLVNFEDYHKEQAQWLASVVKSPSWTGAERRIVLSHIPYLNGYRQEMGDILASASVDLMIAGHQHTPLITEEKDSSLPYPVILGGGSEKQNAAAVQVDWANHNLSAILRGIDGRVIGEWNENN